MKMQKHVINALWEKLLKVGTEDRISLFGHDSEYSNGCNWTEPYGNPAS